MSKLNEDSYKMIKSQLSKVYQYDTAKTLYKSSSHDVFKIASLVNYKPDYELLKGNLVSYTFDFLLIGDQLGYVEYVLEFMQTQNSETGLELNAGIWP